MDPRYVLQPGIQVDIVVTAGRFSRTFMSRIVHLTDDLLHLAAPGPQERPIFLPRGQAVVLHIKPENELYVAQSQIVGYAQAGSPRLLVARPKTLQRVERRKSVRVPVAIHTEQCDAYLNGEGDMRRLTPTIANISAGGVALEYHRPLPVGTLVVLKFGLPDGYGLIQAKGRIIHTRAVYHGGAPVYIMGVAFTHIAVRDSDAIMRYALEQERAAVDRR